MVPSIVSRKCISISLIVLLSASLAGCCPWFSLPFKPDAVIATGSYARTFPNLSTDGETYEPIALNVTGMQVDRDQGTVTFELKDGLEVRASLDMDSLEWVEGCPDMAGDTDMEFVNLGEEELTLDGIVFEHPLLVATCPTPPTVLVLREYGDGSGDPSCDWWEGAKCMYFRYMP